MNTDSETKPSTPRKRRWWIAPAVIAGILLTTFIWFKITYPYGVTHCCSDGIAIQLHEHAEKDSFGSFPFGATTPEGSFSLLAKDNDSMLAWVCGKNIPASKAREVWKQKGELTPESCGWHYVEGLRTNDDPQIAIAWDKIFGLGHNGQRIRGLAHEVILVNGERKGIAMKEWPKFALEQRERLAKVIASRPTNAPSIRWSDVETLGTNRFSW